MAEIIKLKKGDVALRLNQFDNFRLFNLYNDGVDDSRPMDLTGDAEYFLIFQSNKKEIRIPEFKDYDKNKLNIDKSQGQLLFFIDKGKAREILTFTEHKFFITRIYVTRDYVGRAIIKSQEELLYNGIWEESTDTDTGTLSEIIESSTEDIEKYLQTIETLNNEIADLRIVNTNLMGQIVDLNETINNLTNEVNELSAKVYKYETGNEYTGEIVDASATLVNINTTEREFQDKLRKLMDALND